MSGDDDRSRPPAPKDESDLPPLPLEGQEEVPEEVPALPALLGDRYETVSRLGKGAFGEVFRARDQVLGREVAVKRIRLDAFVEAGQLEEVKRRFLREAQVAAKLSHPNIVTTHDIVSGPSTSFIVMELVEGDALQTLLQVRGPLPLAEVLDILEQVAVALEYAHAAGIVHRDIKPGNIMIEPSGLVKVMDFGIAKLDTGANLTSTGLILGTPSYMSPEQARGQAVDPRADVFSLGCVLYECVTGIKPFEGESVTATLLKILTEPPPTLAAQGVDLPAALDSVFRRALAKEPSQRFVSTAELVRAARQAAEHGTEAPPPPVPEGTGTVVTRAAVEPAAAPAPDSSAPGGSRGVASPRPSLPGRQVWPLVGAVLAVLAVLVGVFVGVQALRFTAPSPPAAKDGRLVVEEELGFFGRMLGREPRLLVTVPAATVFRVELRTAVSSATARPGDAFTAEVRRTVKIEEIPAVEAGARVFGRLSSVTRAEEAGGRGGLTLEFDSVALPGGREVKIEATPVVLRAPPPKRSKKGFMGGLAEAKDTIGGFFGGKKGAGAGVAYGEHGADVALASGHALEVRLAAPVVVTRDR